MNDFDLKRIYKYIEDNINNNKTFVIAIDGMCASGKTTLANQLVKKYDASIVHIDDFYLPPELRTEERLKRIGGNIHLERLKEQVIDNITDNITYQVFSCNTMSYVDTVHLKKKQIIIVEGTYSLHPYLGNYMDLAVFLKISNNTQFERLKNRNKEKFEQFISKWIPLEKLYFTTYDIENKCTIIVENEC